MIRPPPPPLLPSSLQIVPIILEGFSHPIAALQKVSVIIAERVLYFQDHFAALASGAIYDISSKNNDRSFAATIRLALIFEGQLGSMLSSCATLAGLAGSLIPLGLFPELKMMLSRFELGVSGLIDDVTELRTFAASFGDQTSAAGTTAASGQPALSAGSPLDDVRKELASELGSGKAVGQLVLKKLEDLAARSAAQLQGLGATNVRMKSKLDAVYVRIMSSGALKIIRDTLPVLRAIFCEVGTGWSFCASLRMRLFV